MTKMPRPHRKNIRLSDEERWCAEMLSKLDGDSDDSAVYRRYMLKEARARGLVYPSDASSAHKEKTPKP
jgi:hypothetical protein